MTDGYLICDDIDIENPVPITRELLEKYHVNFYGRTCSGTFGSFHVRTLSKYGIYLTNNLKKINHVAMERKIAGRKRS